VEIKHSSIKVYGESHLGITRINLYANTGVAVVFGHQRLVEEYRFSLAGRRWTESNSSFISILCRWLAGRRQANDNDRRATAVVGPSQVRERL